MLFVSEVVTFVGAGVDAGLGVVLFVATLQSNSASRETAHTAVRAHPVSERLGETGILRNPVVLRGDFLSGLLQPARLQHTFLLGLVCNTQKWRVANEKKAS